MSSKITYDFQPFLAFNFSIISVILLHLGLSTYGFPALNVIFITRCAIVVHCKMVRVVNKILSCWVNTRHRQGIKHLVFRLVLYFFYFPLKVARGHFHNNLGNSWPLPLNDSPDGYRTECSQIWPLNYIKYIFSSLHILSNKLCCKCGNNIYHSV